MRHCEGQKGALWDKKRPYGPKEALRALLSTAYHYGQNGTLYKEEKWALWAKRSTAGKSGTTGQKGALRTKKGHYKPNGALIWANSSNTTDHAICINF